MMATICLTTWPYLVSNVRKALATENNNCDYNWKRQWEKVDTEW